MAQLPLIETNIDLWPVQHGKVREVYDLGDRLLLVCTDRISAYDWVLPTGIPDKGRVLTQVSRFWFESLDNTPNHLITSDVHAMDLPEEIDRESLAGRTMLVKKTKVVPFECVVRGYLSGSGWKDYCATGQVCGITLPTGLVESQQLPEPIFTPATKAEQGDHDENVSFEVMRNAIGNDLANELRQRSIELYQQGAKRAAESGILIADTKFEFGMLDDEIILIDEAMTPDSSRFWPADSYKPGGPQLSFDKQFVRDWLTQSTWDKNSPPPELPQEIVVQTRGKYIEAFERLTGETFAWK